jgi:hypothetical protein
MKNGMCAATPRGSGSLVYSHLPAIRKKATKESTMLGEGYEEGVKEPQQASGYGRGQCPVMRNPCTCNGWATASDSCPVVQRRMYDPTTQQHLEARAAADAVFLLENDRLG